MSSDFYQKFIQNRLKGFTVEKLFWITNSIHKDNSNIKFNKIKIKNDFSKRQLNAVVFLHDFSDNPHAYGRLRNSDFYEWIIYD